MKKILEILLLLLLPFLVLSQESVSWSREAVADALEIDRLGNIYLVKGNVVAKYDAEMNFLCAYDNYPAGSMSSLDVFNPFKVIVFYSEFNKLMYLDSKFAELRSPIMLDDAELYNTKVVCSSSFGGFWI